MAQFISQGDRIEYTPSSAKTAGDVVVLGGVVGVVSSTIAANERSSLQIEGVFDFPKQSGVALTAGAKAYWDNTNGYINATSAGNTYAGVVALDAASGATVVRLKLSPS